VGLTSDQLLQPSVPTISDTDVTDQSLWVKVSPETAVQVSGGQSILAE
jgi:hypothetical protein